MTFGQLITNYYNRLTTYNWLPSVGRASGLLLIYDYVLHSTSVLCLSLVVFNLTRMGAAKLVLLSWCWLVLAGAARVVLTL